MTELDWLDQYIRCRYLLEIVPYSSKITLDLFGLGL